MMMPELQTNLIIQVRKNMSEAITSTATTVLSEIQINIQNSIFLQPADADGKEIVKYTFDFKNNSATGLYNHCVDKTLSQIFTKTSQSNN